MARSFQDKKISAIIACHNEAPTIPFLYDRMKKTFEEISHPYEIIFVNDGSPDNSESLLADLAKKDPHVVAINMSRNFGAQNAFIAGMELCTGDAVVLFDGDLQDPPELMKEFVAKWKEGYDVVYGIRAKRDAKLVLRIGYKLFYKIWSKLSYIKVPRDAGDFGLMDRKVVEVILAMPERDIFVRGMRAWAGYKQIGVPFDRPERMFGVTHHNFLKNVRWAKKGVFSFSYEPLEYIFYISIVSWIIALIGIVFYGIAYFVFPDQPKGITTIIVLVLFFSSVQLLSLSIIGEYLGRIFEEVKARPKYVIKSVFNKPEKKD